jgi:hypothetical protein
VERDSNRPFRFYDNRQKYLTFVTTCDEKWTVAERAARELRTLAPRPPALRLFDAGVGDGTVLAHLLSAMHAQFPTVPFYVVGKEISLEDVRLTLGKLPDRFVEHPQTVVVLTNLHYAEAPYLQPATEQKRARQVFHTVQLDGDTAYGFDEQLRRLDGFLAQNWDVRPSEKTGNPLYVTPSVLVIHRQDQAFALDNVVPRVNQPRAEFDLVLASQPWRSRMAAEFKVSRILAPLARALGSRGTLLGIQSRGGDPGLDIVRHIWPGEEPFAVDRHALLDALRQELGDEARTFDLMAMSDAESDLTYRMHTLPTEIGNRIGTSTLFAAWNAAIYVAQIEDDRVEQATLDGKYLDATAEVLRSRGGLWFNDETFLVRRH